jgi:dTDP-4-dehydrorhamnose 3,5-epimerase
MRIETTALPGVIIIEPVVFEDSRGAFFESWERDRYAAIGLPTEWRQDNTVRSIRGALRGLHFQHPVAQQKLVSVLAGEIFDVAVDVRRGSPSFGKWIGVHLSAANRRQLFVPEGFAHGYLVLSDFSVVTYKASDRYNAATDHCLRWDDPEVGIAWPAASVVMSDKDRAGLRLGEFPPDELPSV